MAEVITSGMGSVISQNAKAGFLIYKTGLYLVAELNLGFFIS